MSFGNTYGDSISNTTTTMRPLLSILTGLWLSWPSAAQLDVLDTAKNGLLTEISAIKDPIDKTIVSVGSSQCSNVKRILGVEYDQITEQGNEPDLSQLTLEFITRSVKVSYNLSAAADLVPSSRWFNPQAKLVIYMHGFTDDPSKDSYKNISNAFFSQDDFNILALDASSLINFLYLRASTYVRFIGERLGEVLAGMERAGLNPSAIHLIGHSLGAQISGFAGKTFYIKTGKRVGRISGLDPAGPCFTTVDDDLKLNRTDADFVDVIHSDAGVYGLDEVLGHADFYPNSGSTQPNCLFQTCSHSRAWLLFAESVLFPHRFPAVFCSSWDDFKNGKCDYNKTSYMGYECSTKIRGNFYLQTSGTIPYGKGEDGLKFVNNDGILKNVGSFLTSLG